MNVKEIANSTIPSANDVKHVLFPDGGTDDIIAVIRYADQRSAPYTRNFAARLKGPTVKDTCSNLWKFVKENVGYVEDGFTHQDIKSPAQLWKDLRGDCKSFSVFIASCLQNLRIPYKFRFVSFAPLSRRVTHVYVVVPDGDSEIICDAVWHSFNQQKPFYYKRDIMGTEISYVSGVGTSSQRYKPGMLKLPPASELNKVTDMEMDLLLAKQNAEIKRNNLRRIVGVGSLQEENYTAKIGAIDDLIQAVRANDRAGDPEMISLIADDIDRGNYNMADRLSGIGDVNDRGIARIRIFDAMRHARSRRHSDYYNRMAILARRKAGAAKTEGERIVWLTRYNSYRNMMARVHGDNMDGIGKSFFGKLLRGAAKGLKAAGKFAGKVAKGALKVITLPMRLAAKGILEITLPKISPMFLYLFINNQALINQLPDQARRKRKKAEKFANFIVNAIGMKRSHFMGIVRNGIEKRYHMSPEKYLGGILKKQISGVGFLPLIILFPMMMSLIGLLFKIFGKKASADETPTASDTPDPESDFGAMTADQQSQLGTQITNQPVPTFTAASYQSSGGGGSSGGDDGSGNSQAALADSSDTADASKGGATEAATEETGPDPAQASTGWC